MFCKKMVLGSILLLLSCDWLNGQSFSAFQSLHYSHSIYASGLGEQGVATKNAFDAMQYNPANLVFAENLAVSYNRNPWGLIFEQIPLTSLNVITKLPNGASMGLAYTYWDEGEWTSTTTSPNGYVESGKFHFYERSLAAGYAQKVGKEFFLGGSIRYAWIPIYQSEYMDHLLFSVGAMYVPEKFSDRLSFGLSLMNFSTRIEVKDKELYTGKEIIQSSPPPSQMNVGINAVAVTNHYFDINFLLGFKKPFDKLKDPSTYEAQSSFASLLNDWKDFPRDVTGQIGLSYLWHPLDIGPGLSFFQEMYLGYFSTGPKDGSQSFFTHGCNIGIKGKDMKASLGYAGRWHNYRADSYLKWEFPWETFQFSISSDMNLFSSTEHAVELDAKPKSIILSNGFARGASLGRMKEQNFHEGQDNAKISYEMKNIWAVEADFYIDDNSAILTAIKYSRMQLKMDLNTFSSFSWHFNFDLGIESFSFESGYRYHPLEQFHPFFVQASIGIIRLNYVLEETTPRYVYQGFDEITAGVMLPLFDTKVVVIPKFGLTTLFLDQLPYKKILAGFNQLRLGVNIGYQL